MKTKKMPKKPPLPVPRNVPEAERTLTVKEVAELDRCSEKTVRRAIDEGMLEAMRVGPGKRLLRITPAALAKYRGAQRT
jgi:excisionase family DNA binding protein